MASSHLDWGLLGELQCPVCLEYMASPIKMCENGHNICGGCKEHLSECPSCRGTFIKGRNIAMEKLAATAVYPCTNREAGCEETFTADKKDSHLAVCLFQSVDCPWTGTYSV
jgi:hypothetical protein